MINYKIYSDGSCINNGLPTAIASWSYVVTDLDDNIIEASTGKLQGIQNNNRAELTAFIKVLKYIKQDRERNTYVVYVDYEALYLFCNGQCKPKSNIDLYREIRTLLRLCDGRVIVEKVKAHKTRHGIVNFINGLVDKLARKSLIFFTEENKQKSGDLALC